MASYLVINYLYNIEYCVQNERTVFTGLGKSSLL